MPLLGGSRASRTLAKLSTAELISSPWVTALEVTVYDLGSIAFGMSSFHDGGCGEEWGHLRKSAERK